jgi:hypothetical protein
VLTGSNITFEQYQASALHEAGHAVMAVVFDRKLIEISILHNEHGSGSVFRELREGSPLEVLEEIAIALSGEEAPLLWGHWVTDAGHDYQRIEHLLSRNVLVAAVNLDSIRLCLRKALEQLRETLSLLGRELSIRKVMVGEDAEKIISSHLPQNINLHECLMNLLKHKDDA